MACEEIMFPNNIRNIRLARGMRMTKVAKDAGLSLSAMSKIEKGVRRLNQKQLLTLCGILTCKLSDVFIKENDDMATKWKDEIKRRLFSNETNGLKIFGSGLRHLRRESGKTIATAAKDSSLTLSVYHKLEIGQREIYEDEIKPLAKSFGRTPESLFKAIAELYKAGKLTEQIDKVEEKVKSVLIPGSPMSGVNLAGSLYGAKIYDSARKKLVPIFGTPSDKDIIFKKSDEKMIIMPINLEGKNAIYAIIPNVKRLGGAFPMRSYVFIDADAAVVPGDLALHLGDDFDKIELNIKIHAQLVLVKEDAKGKLYGQMFNPDEKIAIKNTNNSLHKVVQIVTE